MILVEIVYGTAKEQEYISKKQSNGTDIGDKCAFIRQHCLVTGHSVNGFPATNPRDATILLGIVNKSKGGLVPQAYKVGLYVISPESIYFDRDALSLSRVKLQPLEEHLAEVGRLLASKPDLRNHINPQPKAA